MAISYVVGKSMEVRTKVFMDEQQGEWVQGQSKAEKLFFSKGGP